MRVGLFASAFSVLSRLSFSVLPLLCVLVAMRLASHHSEWAALVQSVEEHVDRVHDELQQLFNDRCAPEPPMELPHPRSQAVGNVNVPACSDIEASVGQYYGNLHMLLVEAWLHKILPTLLTHEASAVWLPHAALLHVHDDPVFVDGSTSTLAGAIFVLQLRQASGWPSDAAMMIGIHRMPRHKRGARGRPVAGAIVERAKSWCNERHLRRLFVCPYQELKSRLELQGFALSRATEEPATAALRFGNLALNDVCEEGTLLVARLGDG